MNHQRMIASTVLIPVVVVVAVLMLGFLLGPMVAHRVAFAAQAARNDADREMLRDVGEYDTMSKLFRTVSRVVRPAVVEVQVAKKVRVPQGGPFGRFEDNWPFGGNEEDMPQVPREREFIQRGLGSGVIVDSEKGFILTNHHVVQGAKSDDIEVVLHDGRKIQAEWVRSDPPTDLAIVKIKPDRLISAPLGDSDKMAVGDWVLAIGSPEGLHQTVTAGIISAKGRTTNGQKYQDFLQTDAAINHGNSGGPLVNMKGQVIGINTAIVSRTGVNEGIGLSIPSNMARNVMDQLVSTGRVVRGYLGVRIDDIDERFAKKFDIPTTKGSLIHQVVEGSPADKAELRPGDFIVSVNGNEIANSNDLRNEVAVLKPNQTYPFVIYRDGEKQTVKVTIDEQPKDMWTAAREGVQTPDQPDQFEKLGLEVRTLTPELAKEYGYNDDTGGVLITGVERGSDAADRGLRRGLVIFEADKKPIKDTEDLRDAIADSDGGLILRVMDPSGSKRFVLLTPEK